MITLSNDKVKITKALEAVQGSVYIKETVRLYLEAYGTDYDFSQFYIQYSDAENSESTAVIYRYNTQVYALTDPSCELCEVCDFLSGFLDYTVIADEALAKLMFGYTTCCVMCKSGETVGNVTNTVIPVDSPKLIAELVTKDEDKSKSLDFFLNTAHQLRHNLISVAGCIMDDTLVSVVAATASDIEYSVITFVYTDTYFRGNGIASDILKHTCCDQNKKYVLLCEEHNEEFYNKCGFKTIQHCIKFNL